jgi:hypothetical protein
MQKKTKYNEENLCKVLQITLQLGKALDCSPVWQMGWLDMANFFCKIIQQMF